MQLLFKKKVTNFKISRPNLQRFEHFISRNVFSLTLFIYFKHPQKNGPFDGQMVLIYF